MRERVRERVSAGVCVRERERVKVSEIVSGVRARAWIRVRAWVRAWVRAGA